MSLFIPTVRGSAGAAANALRFKNALKEAETRLATSDPVLAAKALARLTSLDNSAFWGEQRAAFAAFASPTFSAHFRLGDTTEPAVVVADSFHTKPLVKYLQGEVRYYLLTLAKENITLWEGGRDSLDIVVVPGMPRGLRDLEESRAREHMPAGVRSTGLGRAVHGGGEIDPKDDLKALFRLVDRALFAFTHDEKTPLILATFDHYHPLFHEVSKNAALLDEGVHGDPASLSREQLGARALAILLPRRQAALKALSDEYNLALNAHRATNYLPNIAKAAVYGRVKTLLIEDGRSIPGRLDRTTGEVTRDAQATSDLLDDAGELVLGAGGHVYVLPKAMMPTDVGVAAIYRY